jgi:DNA-binding response OmpR family regulator
VPRILVVEDEPAVCEQLAAMLKKAGHEVLTARDGGEALQALGVGIRFPPPPVDVVLLDVMLPNVNGFMVCTRMQEDERAKGVPVIMVSGYDDFKDPFSKFPNIAGWIDKPFEPRDVLEKLAEALGKKTPPPAAA